MGQKSVMKSVFINQVAAVVIKENRRVRLFHWITFLFLFNCFSCTTNHVQLEPDISFIPSPQLLEAKPSPFPPLTAEEYKKDWGKEIVIASSFASELDFYRAITSFKRASILLPPQNNKRKEQIEYGIFQCYYLGQRYSDAIETFEKGCLRDVTENFPAYQDLLTILYDCYLKLGEVDKAFHILSIMESKDSSCATSLKLYNAVREADFVALQNDSQAFLFNYHLEAKSIRKAEMLNAALPGLGYLYVGQKETAFTSFVINALFIAAAYQFFHHGNIAAGIITTSLETGWYFGGIKGAGLAAKEFNERLYERHAKDFLIQENLFPILMLHFSF